MNTREISETQVFFRKFVILDYFRWIERVNRANGWRSELNLKYEQRIQVALKGSAKLESVAAKHVAYIQGETLATELKVGDLPAGWQTEEKATLAL